MLQFNQGEKTKKSQEVSTKAQGLFATHFEKVLQHTIDPCHSASFAVNQDVIAYFSGQCLPNLPVETIKDLDLKVRRKRQGGQLIDTFSSSDRRPCLKCLSPFMPQVINYGRMASYCTSWMMHSG
jgi:hypothetical protein